MCFTHRLLERVPHDAFSVVEDVEYGIRIGRAGTRVHYVHEAHVLGEFVSGEQASRSQRQRWEQGRGELARKLGLPLLFEGLRSRSPLLLDLALDVLVPPLAVIAAFTFAGLAGSLALSAIAGGLVGSVYLWAFCCVALLAYVARGWSLSGTGGAGLLALARAPLYVAWKARLLFVKPAKKGEWVRTTREAEQRTVPPPT
jgi:1,2-diacylglycerol 3-beta-glucosyltransferase